MNFPHSSAFDSFDIQFDRQQQIAEQEELEQKSAHFKRKETQRKQKEEWTDNDLEEEHHILGDYTESIQSKENIQYHVSSTNGQTMSSSSVMCGDCGHSQNFHSGICHYNGCLCNRFEMKKSNGLNASNVVNRQQQKPQQQQRQSQPPIPKDSSLPSAPLFNLEDYTANHSFGDAAERSNWTSDQVNGLEMQQQLLIAQNEIAKLKDHNQTLEQLLEFFRNENDRLTALTNQKAQTVTK